MSSRPKAEVCITDNLERLCFIPQKGYDRSVVRTALRLCAENVPIKSASEGISIQSEHVHLISDVDSVLNLDWQEQSKLYFDNRTRVSRNIQSIIDTLFKIKNKSIDANSLIGEMQDIDRLDDHQKVNVAAMTMSELPGLCIFDEQGAGKTVTFIYAFDLLVQRDEVDIALIIAPKSMVPEWPNDLHRFKGDLYKSAVISGSRKEKLKIINSHSDFYVTNFETAVAMEAELKTLLRLHRGRAIIVVDESFYIKNLDAKRTKAIRRLREYCDRAYVLCGTPAPNSPLDLVQQFNIIDFGYAFAGSGLPEDKTEVLPVVQQIIEDRGMYIRHLKKDVLPDLPIKRFNRVLLPLEPAQRKLYTGALNDLILDLQSTEEESFQKRLMSFLARRTALLQICSNPVSLSNGYSEIPAKLLALDTLLEDLISQRSEKVIIWSFYTASIDAIVARYRHYNTVRYDGTISDISVRRQAVKNFQEDKETMLFVANPAAAGAGLTLHSARYAIYESMSNQAAHYLQSLDRIHRRGQSRDVEYLILLCERTIEVEEYGRLIEKENSAQALLGDNVDKAWTRETMLAEALDASRFLLEGEESNED